MPKNKNETLCVEDLRHAEYYEMQNTFDDLYAKSKNGDIFIHLMDIILSRENILLAYRNIKANAGSKTAGTDGTIIKDIGKLPAETVVKKVRYIVAGSPHGYRPKPVRRKEIPKPNGKTRPLGIPCMWDRLIQQCIKQVLEPICEAKFSENSYGFRPNRSVENAIKATYNRLQISQLHYVIEFDIKGFFDNVQNYYQIATNVNLDCMKLNRAVMAIFTNRLGTNKRGRLRKTGRQLTTKEATRYGKSKMLRYVAGEGEPIFPVGYIQHRKPMAKVYLANCYTLEGRKFIHTNLSVDKLLMYQLMKLSLENRTIEYADNRISLFSAQHGKCAITLEEFQQANEIHCHHIVPTGAGGNDDYKNLIWS